jgi:indole-3-glycerol phosphate synthase
VSDSDFLQAMAVGSHERLQAARRECSEAVLLAKALASPEPVPLRAHPERFDLIAEMKLRSPAVGQLKSSTEDVVARVSAYAHAGAAAVSVLTEPSRFDGAMAHLELAAKTLTPLRVPAMRKDFLVDPYQVLEARVAGAGGVLVIVRMLSREGIEAMLDCAAKMGLFVLLEAFDERDIEVMHGIVGAGNSRGTPVLAGLNCRDLATLQIVPRRLLELAHLLPSNVPRVAESGVGSAEDAGRVAAAGYEYALVGSALMQGGDPHALATAMLKAGRGEAGPGAAARATLGAASADRGAAAGAPGVASEKGRP